MHAIPEWFAMHESWCSAYNNTNDPIAGVYLLYKEKAVQNHGIVLLKNSNTWQPTVKHWNMVLQMEGTAVSSSSSAPLLYQIKETSVVYTFEP